MALAATTVMHPVDQVILVAYFLIVVVTGAVIARRAGKNVDSYFLGGRSIPWYMLGISNASGQFDITGTMWMVMLMFVYGVKSVWVPWVWPMFNQVFLMVFLSAWLRRSNALTGAEWLQTRFGKGRGLELAHASVVLFALVSVLTLLAYAYVGIGKFAEAFLPWDLDANSYALIIISLTACYVVAGGMYSVVLTDLIQFFLLSIAAVCIGWIAIARTTPEQIAAATPDGWGSVWFSWNIGLDWSEQLALADKTVREGGYELFTIFISMALLKGVLSSLAGPVPNYDMQRVLATRGPRESSLMSGIVSPVLYLPRYLLISGIAVLGIVYFSDSLAEMGDGADFEQVLPYVMQQFVPVGVKGILLAGLLAAFMSTFDSTVNAGAAYLVNDIYKRYLRPGQAAKHYMRASYACSLGVVGVGMFLGAYLGGAFDSADAGGAAAGRRASIDDILQWITAGLFGGYTAPNVLKWVWWRLNGAGYFVGMVSGVLIALATTRASAVIEYLADRFPETVDAAQWSVYVTPLNLFPLLLVFSGAAAIAASLLTEPNDEAVACSFYRRVRPWGFWRPIHEKVVAEDPSFEANRDFGRDSLNCAIGIVWQVGLCLMPMYAVLRRWDAFLWAVGVVLVTSVALKRLWYDRLESDPAPVGVS